MEESNSPAKLCIFEDDRYANFFPLALNRPLFDLRIGTQTLWKRLVEEINPEQVVLLCRPYLAPVLAEVTQGGEGEASIRVNEATEGDTIFLNGRLLTFGRELSELVEHLPENSVLHKNGTPVAARLSGETAAAFASSLAEPLSDENTVKLLSGFKDRAPTTKRQRKVEDDAESALRIEAMERWSAQHGARLERTETVLLSYYWQLIGENGRCIMDDFAKIPVRGAAAEAELFRGVEIINEDDIVIGSEVQVRSGTVLDASEGPIIIADNVQIEPNAILYGPCFIGEHSIVRGGAKIGRAASVGRECRVGGEITETIIASYTNKQHEGFLGHSYVGSWVNLGAGCNNSDLKNNYGTIRAWCAGEYKETGRRFLGAVVGDHAKVAINTRLNTGTVIGFNANVMTIGFPPKFIPSFTWTMEPAFEEHDLDKATTTAEIMTDRRNVVFTPAMAELFRVIFRFCRQSGHSV